MASAWNSDGQYAYGILGVDCKQGTISNATGHTHLWTNLDSPYIRIITMAYNTKHGGSDQGAILKKDCLLFRKGTLEKIPAGTQLCPEGRALNYYNQCVFFFYD